VRVYAFVMFFISDGRSPKKYQYRLRVIHS